MCGNTGRSELLISLLRGKWRLERLCFWVCFVLFLKGQNKYFAKTSKNKVMFSVGSYDWFPFPSLKNQPNNNQPNKRRGKVLATFQLKQKQHLQQLRYRAGWEPTPQYTCGFPLHFTSTWTLIWILSWITATLIQSYPWQTSSPAG